VFVKTKTLGFPSVAGFTLIQEDDAKNFILLTANITESSGKGVWQTTKFTNNEPLSIVRRIN
jgi:hypothetical protein